MIKDIFIPASVRKGILPYNRPHVPADVWGADFETVEGKPYTFQICHGGGSALEYLDDPSDGLWRLLDAVEVRREHNVRVYFWGLSYDLPCLLFARLEAFQRRDWACSFDYGGKRGRVTVSCFKSWFAVLKWGAFRVHILDAFQFFRTSLDKASAEILKDSRKYVKPRGLGVKKLTGKRFERYALRDAEITYKIGLIIEKQHEMNDIDASISASNYAAKVFRRRYLAKKIPYIPKEVEKAAILSYHGGLNYVTPDAPALIRGVSEYDITSAYPAAFCALPDVTSKNGRWVRCAPETGAFGFVRIRFGNQCAFDAIRGHGFEKIAKGIVWTTSLEWEAARGCLQDAEIVDAWTWVGPEGPSPFKRYMQHYLQVKSAAETPAEKEFAKICLNGMYGKLIQSRENETGIVRAGGLWNPALASLVTAHTRAVMHRYLHKYSALHCATDSFCTTHTLKKNGTGMGGLVRKTYGDLLLLRNKLYIFLDPETEKILKWGAHGFWGSAEELISMWREKRNTYKIGHIYKVREALRQNKVPLMMQEVERKLSITWDKYKEINSHGQGN